MTEFIALYGLIIAFGCLSAVVSCAIKKRDIKEEFLYTSRLGIVYYYAISIIRMIAGNGHTYLSTSFHEKTISSYLKIMLLIVIIFILHMIFDRLFKCYKNLVVCWTDTFLIMCLFYMLLVQYLTVKMSVVAGGIALILSAGYLLLQKRKNDNTAISDGDFNNAGNMLLRQLILALCLYYVVGVTELYAYNRIEFIYSYGSIISCMLISGIGLVAVIMVYVPSKTNVKAIRVISYALFIINILSYFQGIALNGKMMSIDGGKQVWDTKSIVFNSLIWILISITIILLIFKASKSKILIAIDRITEFIIALQLTALVFTLFTTQIPAGKNSQILYESLENISPTQNIVVFILDSYDIQMIDAVLEDRENYLDELHDFEYYNHMDSMYYYTDKSMPLLLTGVYLEDDDEQDIYSHTTFLKDIKLYDYDIQILTDSRYIRPLEEGIVSNFSKEGYCIVDVEKTVATFLKCMRYRNMPFLLKNNNKYEAYDLTNIIYKTNMYLFGEDDKFNKSIEKLRIDTQMDKNMLKIIHLYGAHCPYYLDENVNIDYQNNNPIAQWKGALKIVYNYIDRLKELQKYEDTTIIIMADHGLNRTQNEALRNQAINIDSNKSNPIFFIKKANNHQEHIKNNPKEVSHLHFFDTLMKCIDNEWNNKYWGTIWE